MSRITDEMVETVAKAILAAELWPGAWDKANETERGHVLYKARAAIEAAAPMIRDAAPEEAAARIIALEAALDPFVSAIIDAETTAPDNAAIWEMPVAMDITLGHLRKAAAIRAMKEQKP